MNCKEARAQGLKHYDGKPCKNCTGTKRFVSNGSCVQCTTERTKARSPEVYKRYAQSDKGKANLSEYRKTDTAKEVYKRHRRKHKGREYHNNKDTYRNNTYLRKYGITLEEYDAMLEQQDGKCWTCGTEPDDKNLAVDHCHDTGTVRGLLCSKCNMALGLLDEDIDVMMKMIEYVKVYR